MSHGLARSLLEQPPGAAGHDPCRRYPYVLHVGGRDGYKRFDLLVCAFAAAGLPGHLVSVGGRRQLNDAERALVAELGLGPRVKSLGYVEDDVLAALYRGARVVAVTSDAEGYGLPMREAVALGVPLVAPRLAVTAEVVGDAAHTFIPGDAASLAMALRDQWEHPLTVNPASVAAARHGWDEAAAALVDVMTSKGRPDGEALDV